MTYDEFYDYCSDNKIRIDCSTLEERQEFRTFVLSLDPNANTEYISDKYDLQTYRYAGPSRFGRHFCLYTERGAEGCHIMPMKEFRATFAGLMLEQEITCPSLEGVL